MGKRKLKKILERDYGKAPDPYYFHGDMEYIRAYYDFRRDNNRDEYLIDDITWNDLDMDKVFKRINPKLSTSGEQYLYYMLRSPAIKKEQYTHRKTLIDYLAGNAAIRLKLQLILARLGCTRRADLCNAFYPSSHGICMLILYLFLMLLVPLALLSIILFSKYGIMALVLVLLVNSSVHEFAKRKIERNFDTVNYSVAMIFALNKIRKLHDSAIDAELQEAYVRLDRLRSVIRTGGISTVSDNGGMGDIITTFLLLDLIAYEFLKNKLGRNHEDVFAVHENLGKIDASIAVGSYQESASCYCSPELDFVSDKIWIQAEQMTHPLLENAVPNSLTTVSPILITGSNASGKSTFLKTAALCAIMAQSICTCTAKSYRGCVFRVYSSMALSDNLLSGESYYVVETKSLKRILDRVPEKPPVLCVVDEVLRGTNTIERIAASCEVLKTISEQGALCLAATHDVELCELLSGSYSLYHFEEEVDEHEMRFDYMMREGKATSRNAINLLRLIGFDSSIVDGAHERADRFVSYGKWER